MRVCIVGCGAVGSLFAANLATLDDVEVWAYDLAQDHVDAINRDGLRLTGAGDVVGRLRATTDPAELPACDFGLVATKAMHTDGAIAATAHAFADGCVATVQNGIGNEEVLAAHCRARDPRHDVPGGEARRAGRRAVGRQGRHDLRPVRGRARRRWPRSSGSPRPARAPACRRTRSPTRAGRSGAR